MTPPTVACFSILMLIGASAAAQPAPGQPATPARADHAEDWHTSEGPILSAHVRLTSPEQFTKAGEAYFSPDGEWIIFQAVEVGQPANAPYAMYAAPLKRSADAITGMGEPVLLSPPGSANTCGWFHPTDPAVVMFGSTIDPPRVEDAPGYKVGQGRYLWAFPEDMQICTRTIPVRWVEANSGWPGQNAPGNWDKPVPLISRDGYDAECSWSADGRYVLYAHVEPVTPDENGVTPPADADIWIYDSKTDTQTSLVAEPGYDGGPFFSPDGKWICYRSDRARNDHLQIYIAELAFDAAGKPTGVSREIALTANDFVNWCPYWDKSGRFLVYGTSELGHENYEIFAIDADPSVSVETRARIPVTRALGADVLPAFDSSGKWMMWTSKRQLPDDKGTSTTQLWVARFNGAAIEQRLMSPAEGQKASN